MNTEDTSILLGHDQTDALVRSTTEQISYGTFDNNETVIKQLVECLGDTRGMARLQVAQTIATKYKPLSIDVAADDSEIAVGE